MYFYIYIYINDLDNPFQFIPFITKKNHGIANFCFFLESVVPFLYYLLLQNKRYRWKETTSSFCFKSVNDPSAGSPTETLLRLLLPLNDKVYSTSHAKETFRPPLRNPKISPDRSIGRSDGRCVQRAGT